MAEDDGHAVLDECFEYSDHLRANKCGAGGGS